MSPIRSPHLLETRDYPLKLATVVSQNAGQNAGDHRMNSMPS